MTDQSKWSRRHILAGTAATMVAGNFAAARPPTRPPRIGLMMRAGYPEFVAAFTDELARLGHVDGRSVIIEKRLAKPDLSDMPAQADELGRMDLKLVVVGSSNWARAVAKANPRMPVIIITAAGMVESGFAKSLEHPGGNFTGGEELPPGLTGKRMSLLKQAAPNVSRIGLLAAAEDAAFRIQLTDAHEMAKRLNVTVKPYPAPSPQAIEQAMPVMIAEGMNGLVNLQSGFSLAHRRFIVDFAARHRLPAIYQATRFVDAGGLMAWSPDQDEQVRQAAHYADKVLRGAKVGDLPISYPRRYFLTINLAAAKALNLVMPPDLLRSADLRNVS